MNEIEKVIHSYKKCIELINKDLQLPDGILHLMDKPERQEIERAKHNHTIAIQALEKQLPEKPIKIKDRYNPNNTYYDTCPNCGKVLFNKDEYCQRPLCGQRIDWSVQE